MHGLCQRQHSISAAQLIILTIGLDYGMLQAAFRILSQKSVKTDGVSYIRISRFPLLKGLLIFSETSSYAKEASKYRLSLMDGTFKVGGAGV